ncbi:MAG: type II secretion system protein [Desulfobacteraceae bacterium]|nr:type II secretion system protein [Desulfobacteraceae bacterium]
MKKLFKNDQGFTLLEILVVLTIMGFLIAMVAPRLAGISGGAVDTVCDTNQNRMITYMSSFFEQTNRMPNKLTNLVCQDAANYAVPSVSDQDPDNGAETMAREFEDRNQLQIHILNAAEASALKNMGVVRMFNLNSYDNSLVAAGDQGDFMNPVIPVAGVGVAMVGMGHDGTAWAATTVERGLGEPDFFGRIVLGMSAECSLISSGVIANAAHCPGGIQNTDNCTYNDYNLVLPRLEATVARFDTDDNGTIDGTDTAALGFGANADLDVAAVSYDEEPSAAYAIAGNANNLRVRSFDLSEAQENWQFATQCPEGHMYPADDGDSWGFDIDGDGNVN